MVGRVFVCDQKFVHPKNLPTYHSAKKIRPLSPQIRHLPTHLSASPHPAPQSLLKILHKSYIFRVVSFGKSDLHKVYGLPKNILMLHFLMLFLSRRDSLQVMRALIWMRQNMIVPETHVLQLSSMELIMHLTLNTP